MFAHRLFASAFLVLCAPCAQAQEPPKPVVAEARRLEAACEKFDPKAKAPPERQISTPLNDARATIWIVDGSKTACGDSGPACGSGGCMTIVYRAASANVAKIYGEQVLGWKIEDNRTSILFDVHGSRCGGFGPDPCATRLDLATGKTRTFRPTAR
ncbi:MAG: hypothetical protein U1E28_22520 [Beijerinckiaceae bacterium]